MLLNQIPLFQRNLDISKLITMFKLFAVKNFDYYCRKPELAYEIKTIYSGIECGCFFIFVLHPECLYAGKEKDRQYNEGINLKFLYHEESESEYHFNERNFRQDRVMVHGPEQQSLTQNYGSILSTFLQTAYERLWYIFVNNIFQSKNKCFIYKEKSTNDVSL